METWSVILALVAVTLSVYYYLKRNCDYFEKRGIPYKKSLPLFGNTWRAIFSLETYIQTFVDLYNFNRDVKYIGYYEVMQPMIMIRDVELAKQVMVKHFDHFQDRRIIQAGDTENYLDAVLRETMRMYVFISIIDRVCTKRFELPPPLPGAKPVVVEEGDCVQIPIYAIQHDPQYFDNPDTFNPDRFSSDFRKIYNPGTFLTFGQGPRVCIANRFVNIQSKVLLFHLFAKCTLKMCSKTAVPLQYTNSFAMSAKDGVWLEVVPREKSRMVYMESVSDRGVYA